jgi:hypothetical protein
MPAKKETKADAEQRKKLDPALEELVNAGTFPNTLFSMEYKFE